MWVEEIVVSASGVSMSSGVVGGCFMMNWDVDGMGIGVDCSVNGCVSIDMGGGVNWSMGRSVCRGVDWGMGINVMGSWLSVSVAKVSVNAVSILVSVVVWGVSMVDLSVLVVWTVVVGVTSDIVVSVDGVKLVVSHVSVVVAVVVIMVIHGLHLQDQVAARCVHIGWVENGGVCLEST